MIRIKFAGLRFFIKRTVRSPQRHVFAPPFNSLLWDLFTTLLTSVAYLLVFSWQFIRQFNRSFWHELWWWLMRPCFCYYLTEYWLKHNYSYWGKLKINFLMWNRLSCMPLFKREKGLKKSLFVHTISIKNPFCKRKSFLCLCCCE